MIGAHVAHDCVVGDHVILTNQATLGGHSEIGEYAILGGLVGVQQRSRIGAHSFIGGMTGISRDVMPFVMATGAFARLGGHQQGRACCGAATTRRRSTPCTAPTGCSSCRRAPRAERLAAVERGIRRRARGRDDDRLHPRVGRPAAGAAASRAA